MTHDSKTDAAITSIAMGYIGRADCVTGASFEPADEALIFLNDDNEQTCHVEGPNAKAMAQQIVDAVSAGHDRCDAVTARLRAAVIEECAKIAEGTTVHSTGHPQIDAPTPADMRDAIAKAIRALAVPSANRGGEA